MADKKPRKPAVPFADDPDRRALYLFHLSGGTNDCYPGKTGAADLAGVHYNTVVSYRKSHPEFAAEEEAATERWCDKLRHEADRRGRRGRLKGIYHNGARVAREREVSDRLLIQMLQAHCPEHKRHVQVDTNLSGTVGMEALADLSPESRADLRRILEREKKKREES